MTQVIRNAMTAVQLRRARLLVQCSFAPATFDKRFARDMGSRAAMAEPTISWREAATLERLCWKYREQIRRLLTRNGEPALDVVPDQQPPPPIPRTGAA